MDEFRGEGAIYVAVVMNAVWTARETRSWLRNPQGPIPIEHNVKGFLGGWGGVAGRREMSFPSPKRVTRLVG